MNPSLINAFSLRRLNPFSGTLQVFTTHTARALSSNGLSWELQVWSEQPQSLWANTPLGEKRFYTFGLWSRKNGLKQVPINPLFNIDDMLLSAQQLIEGLEAALSQLPFPPLDRYELWSLDSTTGQPIALLNSAIGTEEIAEKDVRLWTAATLSDFSFISPALTEKGIANQQGDNPKAHATALEALVRSRSGQTHARAWYIRGDQGEGKSAHDPQSELPVEAFPELPITLDWDDPEDLALILDYVRWKAPQLLQLTNLSPETRMMLEPYAAKQAAEVERFWRLYPVIHNKTLLNTARIEAKIRQSTQT